MMTAGGDRPRPNLAGTLDSDVLPTLEVREFTVRTAEWIRVSFTQPFSRDPVVVVAPTKGKGPAAIRVRKITTTGFSAIIAKPPKSGKVEPGQSDESMQVSYLAVLPGVHELNGVWMEAGRTNTKDVKFGKKCSPAGLKQDPWGEIEETRFEHTFTRPPALLTTIQTVNNEKGLPSNSRPWLTVAVQRVNEDSTKVALERSETTEYGKVDEREKVGWIAIEQGIHTLLGST
ncbi:unnamed protein product, partial [Durusdinium trenchii]